MWYFLIKHSKLIKILFFIKLFILAICIKPQNSLYNYRAAWDHDQKYLNNTGELKTLKIFKDFMFKITKVNFNVSKISQAYEYELGEKLDIRPPVHLLTLINGEFVNSTDDTYTLLTNVNCSSLWNNIIKVMSMHKFMISELDNINQKLTTSWITWNVPNEQHPYLSRYQITLQMKNNKQMLIVKLIDLQCQGKQITYALQKQKYNTLMMNEISKGLNKIYMSENKK